MFQPRYRALGVDVDGRGLGLAIVRSASFMIAVGPSRSEKLRCPGRIATAPITGKRQMNGELEAGPSGELASRQGAVPVASRMASLLEVLWITLLILPAATTLSASRDWDLNQNALFVVSCWLIVAGRLLVARKSFFLMTLPIMLAGVLCMGADFFRNADLLELVLQWRTFSALDITGALLPYAGITTISCLAVTVLCWAAWRYTVSRPTGRLLQFAIAVITAGLALAVPGTTWLRAWPIDAVLVVASTVTDSHVMAQYLFPATSTVNPRNPKATWNASRVAGAPATETVVFVIGETIRNDYLKECQGPDRVRAVSSGALVACDVTSSSDSTAASVPLLVSREMPGHPVRVSDDATFAHALKEAGFETHWYGAQGSSVAWADADDQSFPSSQISDSALLTPMLASALGRPAKLKAVVLHANNAHDPYGARYERALAPYPASYLDVGVMPSLGNIRDVRLNYANAVDASVGFINGLIAELEKHPEPAFLIFSPDHGENLLDDKRQLFGHARRHPTRWDSHVPAIFWANEAWRSTHAAQWANLKSQIKAPLMHIDLVPTLLDAAGVRYEDRRPMHVDLLAQTVPQRHRIVQQALGATIEWDTLVNEAASAGPPAP